MNKQQQFEALVQIVSGLLAGGSKGPTSDLVKDAKKILEAIASEVGGLG